MAIKAEGEAIAVPRDEPLRAECNHFLECMNTRKPARQIGWMNRHGERLDFSVDGIGEAECPATGERYQLKGNILQILEN